MERADVTTGLATIYSYPEEPEEIISSDQTYLHPYRKLWAAVLLQAIKDLTAGNTNSVPVNNQRKRICGSTQFWLNSDNDGVGSFNYICLVMGMDSVKTRDRMLELNQRMKRKRIMSALSAFSEWH